MRDADGAGHRLGANLCPAADQLCDKLFEHGAPRFPHLHKEDNHDDLLDRGLLGFTCEYMCAEGCV